MKFEQQHFVPCTREVPIGRGVVYRPLRSWHSGTYAGEGRTQVDGDRSGCVWIDVGRRAADPPKSVVHRAYWNKRTGKHVSAFLSYPHGLGGVGTYFWEADIGEDGITRWTGDHAEEEMEAAILDAIGDAIS